LRLFFLLLFKTRLFFFLVSFLLFGFFFPFYFFKLLYFSGIWKKKGGTYKQQKGETEKRGRVAR